MGIIQVVSIDVLNNEVQEVVSLLFEDFALLLARAGKASPIATPKMSLTNSQPSLPRAANQHIRPGVARIA